MQYRAFILEDDKTLCALIETALTESFECTFAHDMRSALNVLAGNGFDVALVDLTMRDSFGLETVNRVLAAAPTLPLVVMTGAGREYELKALELGALDYLTKPISDVDVLEMALLRAIARGKHYKTLHERVKRAEMKIRELGEQR